MGKYNFKNRLLTSCVIAIVYGGTILLSIYVHKIFFDILVILLMVMAGLEISRAIAKKFDKPIDVFVVLNALLGYLAFILVHTFVGKGSGGVTAFFGSLAIVFLICIVYNIFSKSMTIKNVVSTMFVLVYPVSILVYTLALNYLGDPFRVSAIVLLILVSTFTDTFAFLIGVTFKGPKLAPKISPKKTISGAIGGLFGGLLAGFLVWVFSQIGWLKITPISTFMPYNIMHYLIIGFFGSFLTQLGDLIASYIKRTCEIKDFSTILPGHGGIMDRIDGMMISGIFIFIYMTVLSFL